MQNRYKEGIKPMLENGLLYGSFNPMHLSHVELIEKALEHFQYLHIFARVNKGVDLVDWETKKSWLERLNREKFDGRLRIYKLELSFHDKNYGKLDFVESFLNSEKETGIHLDGLICGEDMQYMVDRMKAALPDRKFVVIPRDGRSSSGIRKDIDSMKEQVPDFVYEDLLRLGKT